MPEVKVSSEIAGSVWQIVATVGETVAEEQPLIVLESMKMEIPVLAPTNGVVTAICVTEGSAVAEGEVVAIMQT